MELTFESVEAAARKLSFHERAALAHILIKDLDDPVGEGEKDFETLWLDEAKRRWSAYQRGEIGSSTTDEVLERIRKKLEK